MSQYQLRHFDFYSIQRVVDPPSIFQEPDILVRGIGSNLYIGDSKGNLYIFDAEFNVKTWRAYEGEQFRVTQVVVLTKLNDLIVTIGEQVSSSSEGSILGESNLASPILKVWELERSTNFLNRRINLTGRTFGKQQPYCLKTIRINGTSSKINCFSIADSMNFAGLGLEDGQVILIRGNLAKDRFIKQKVIHSCSEPITGLGFSDFQHTEPGLSTVVSGTSQSIPYFGVASGQNQVSTKNNTEPLHLFITTTRQIVVCSLTGKEEKSILDEQGCALGCASMVDTSFHRGISMARDDAFYFYGPDGRGPCLAYEGIKSFIQWFGTQVVVAKPFILGTIDPLEVSQVVSEDRLVPTHLEIYDVSQKLVGFSKRFDSGIVQVTWAFMGFFVLCRDGSLHRIEERDTRAKLEVLLNQDLYHLAITVANKSRRSLEFTSKPHPELSTANAVAAASGDHDNVLTEEELSDIYRKYGDFLYSKGDYESAMTQYLNTIGFLEPSYVIRKFLDAQRLKSLTTYLQELHTQGQGLANPDHTTLLLNCYTKLKDVTRLDKFIKTNSDKELQFDLETAIKVLRQAGYYDHALFLAHKFHHHGWYFQIQVENLNNYSDAIGYLQTLSLEEIRLNIDTYGRVLIKECPSETISLLLDICSGSVANKKESFYLKPPVEPLTFSNVFVDHPHHLISFLERYCATNLNKHLNSFEITSNKSTSHPAPKKLVVKPTSPELAKSSINLSKKNDSSSLLWNTLLDLYLTSYIRLNTDNTNERGILEHKIMSILTDSELAYDIDHVIVLSKLSGFDQAIVFIYEKLGMYVDIINHWISQDNVKKILESLRKFGPKDSALYTLTLEYFASSPISLLSYPMEFRQVLDYIDHQTILPPVQVIQALSRNSIATIGNLKEFVKKSIQINEDKIAQDLKLIESYQLETETKMKEVNELETSARIFQHTKCSSCSRPLDLPALHFLCRHSFHQRCLGQSQEHCPLCFRNDQLILDLQKRQEAEAYDHPAFLSQLEDAGDDMRFDVITDYLAKNTFQYASLKQ